SGFTSSPAAGRRTSTAMGPSGPTRISRRSSRASRGTAVVRAVRRTSTRMGGLGRMRILRASSACLGEDRAEKSRKWEVGSRKSELEWGAKEIVMRGYIGALVVGLTAAGALGQSCGHWSDNYAFNRMGGRIQAVANFDDGTGMHGYVGGEFRN